MITTVDDAVKRMEAGFWRRYDNNPDLQRKLAGKTRIIQLALTDHQGYWFHILDGKLHAIQPGAHPNADVTVTTTSHDLLAVLNGQLKAMQAYLTGRVKVKASLADIFFAKSLLGG